MYTSNSFSMFRFRSLSLYFCLPIDQMQNCNFKVTYLIQEQKPTCNTNESCMCVCVYICVLWAKRKKWVHNERKGTRWVNSCAIHSAIHACYFSCMLWQKSSTGCYYVDFNIKSKNEIHKHKHTHISRSVQHEKLHRERPPCWKTIQATKDREKARPIVK